jgi:hypothetical protein
MEHCLGRYAPYLYALVRIMIGVQYASHGAQKLFGVLGGVGGTAGRDGPPRVVVGRRRAHRVVRRALDHSRLVGGLGRIPGEWGDGHRLLPAACASRFLAPSQ